MFPDWEARRGARGAGSWFVIGRLRPNVTFEQAQAEMSAIARRLDEQLPASERNRGISVVPLSLQVTGPRPRLALWMLTGAVFCVLLIAATNVASLSLARSASREREIAIRAALGASRARIVRQLLAESLTLAVISGLLGLLVATGGHPPHSGAQARGPGSSERGRPRSASARLGLGPLPPHRNPGWTGAGDHHGAPELAALRPGRRKRRRGRSATRGIRRALVVTEFALAIVLLVGAGLLIRSLWSRRERRSGIQAGAGSFDPARRSGASTATAQRADFYNRVLEQIGSLPGVESAGITSELFIGGNPEQIVTAEGEREPFPSACGSEETSSARDSSRPSGLLYSGGASFRPQDGPDSPRVAIINDAMARRLWPGRDPVGKRFKLGRADSDSPWFTVVGVVGDMRRQGLENEPIPQMFEPLAQNPPRLAILLVRTSMDDPLKMAGAVQAAVRRVEKHAPVYGVTTLENRLGASSRSVASRPRS